MLVLNEKLSDEESFAAAKLQMLKKKLLSFSERIWIIHLRQAVPNFDYSFLLLFWGILHHITIVKMII